MIPTRGDVNVQPIIDHLGTYPEVDDVWVVPGSTPFNRYVYGKQKALHDVIYTQDDDCLTDIRQVLDAYEPGMIVNAMTPEHAAQYTGRQTLIGFGAIFDRSLIDVLDGWEHDTLFLRESDRVFATLNRHKTVFPAIQILDYASDPNRLWKQSDHIASRNAINRRIFERTGIRA